MMTPNVYFSASYEILLEDGSKQSARPMHESGGWNMLQLLKKHGIDVSYSFVMKRGKERVMVITKLPYEVAGTEKEIIDYFKSRGFPTAVDVHLTFKRS